MKDRAILRVSPEEEELQLKFAELAISETDLLQGELNLATLHAELKNGFSCIEFSRIQSF